MLRAMGWSTCPEKAIRDPHWRSIVYYFNCAQVAPLSGWPNEWATWLVDGVCSLKAAIEIHKAEQIKKSTRAPRHVTR